MRKIKNTALSAVITALLLAGCDSAESFELAPISEIRENFSQTTEELKASSFENLDFSKAEFSFPEIDSISKLSLITFAGKSLREMYEFYCDSLETLMPGVYSEEEKLNGILLSDTNRDPYLPYLPIDEYELAAEGGDLMMVFRDSKCYMQGAGDIQWFDNDDLYQWKGDEVTSIPFLDYIDSAGPAVDYITDMNREDKYELIDGEISIKDAAEFADNFIETTAFTPYETSVKKRIIAADVVDIGGGKYGYGFLTTCEYKNVLFDYPELNGVNRAKYVMNDYDDRRYYSWYGQAAMIQSDKVFHMIHPVADYSVKETETYTSIITLQEAARIVSEFYSENMKFSVTKVEAVYLKYEDTAFPCWKFIMRYGGNVYDTLVDMHTGEVHVYIQVGK
ncbi:MAG: hypothetical protein J1F28_06965 [Oscillospiraceae bacterium]|nr:hypothetical protein [Oscillospiraceae bacterium]